MKALMLSLRTRILISAENYGLPGGIKKPASVREIVLFHEIQDFQQQGDRGQVTNPVLRLKKSRLLAPLPQSQPIRKSGMRFLSLLFSPKSTHGSIIYTGHRLLSTDGG
jgi:hypothetical protein